MSCSPAVMYSVCKPDISENFQIRASLCSPCCYIFRAYMTHNLKETCTLWGPVGRSECSLGIHPMFSILCLTVNVHHKEPQQVMDFSLFLLALYLLWDNFLISEMTSIHMNNTAKKTPCQPVCAFRLACWEQKAQHFHICVIFGFERGVNEICAFSGGFYATSIDSFSPKFRNSWWWWNCHSGVGEDSSHLGLFALSTGQFTCIFRANSPRWRHYVPPKRPSPVDRV